MNQPQLPFVSVITAIYNQEALLAETIECVINQTFTNWEYLLVDDGSSDKSSQIAKDYAEKSNGKIIYLEHEGHVNKGVSATRNLGLKKARGQYISLVDGDDLWLPEKLQQQVTILKESPEVGMLCESSYYWYSGSAKATESKKISVGVPADRIYKQPELVLKLHPLGPGDAPCVGGLIMKTSVMRSLGGFEESFVRKHSLYEDQSFLTKIYLNVPVYVSSACNNYYRLHPQSAMHSLIASGHDSRGRNFFLQWLSGYLLQHPVPYPAVYKLLRKARRSHRCQGIHNVLNGIVYNIKRIIKKIVGPGLRLTRS